MTRSRSDSGSGAQSFEHLVKICNQIGNLCADGHGFVSVRSLLDRFQTELISRPLLVEAMIADRWEAQNETSRWAVLIDSERFPINKAEIDREAFSRTLPVRFRFTVAHELAHSVSFRPTEFGMLPKYSRNKDSSRRDIVQSVERETDRVAPMLLLPDSTIRTCLSGRGVLDASELKLLCDNFGVSRHALINRLALVMRPSDQTQLRETEALANVGIGLGEWDAHGRARLRKWPLFVNFHNQIVPSIFVHLAKQDYLPVESLIKDKHFVLCGGVNSQVELTCEAGLPGLKADEQMNVKVTVETTSKRPGSRFLFALSKRREDCVDSLRPARQLN